MPKAAHGVTLQAALLQEEKTAPQPGLHPLPPQDSIGPTLPPKGHLSADLPHRWVPTQAVHSPLLTVRVLCSHLPLHLFPQEDRRNPRYPEHKNDTPELKELFIPEAVPGPRGAGAQEPGPGHQQCRHDEAFLPSRPAGEFTSFRSLTHKKGLCCLKVRSRGAGTQALPTPASREKSKTPPLPTISVPGQQGPRPPLGGFQRSHPGQR